MAYKFPLVNLVSGVTGTLQAANGGTSQSTYAAGDILYASATNTLSKLPVSTNGKVLTLTAGLPSWQTPSSGGVTSISGTTNQIAASSSTGAVTLSLVGPYTPATYTIHGVLLGQGTSSITSLTNGTTGQVLTANTGADPSWQAAAVTVTTGDIITQVFQGMGA